MTTISSYGGAGVDVSIRSMDTTPQIWWSPQRYREENGRREPAGGTNSYVIVADDTGEFRTKDGTRVALLSINGHGEIRWRVTKTWGADDAEGALDHFGLVLVGGPFDPEFYAG